MPNPVLPKLPKRGDRVRLKRVGRDDYLYGTVMQDPVCCVRWDAGPQYTTSQETICDVQHLEVYKAGNLTGYEGTG